jgi:hypothetical protein
VELKCHGVQPGEARALIVKTCSVTAAYCVWSPFEIIFLPKDQAEN